MRILVVGGAGYIGSSLVPILLARGYEVGVVDLLWFDNHLPKEVKVVKKDVLDLNESDVSGYNQVIFLAGLSNDPMAEFSPSLNFISNAAAPAYLGYICKNAKVRRFIFAGTCSVYGYTKDRLFDETDPAISSYPYGISKLQGEQSLLQLRDNNFSVISLRKGTVSGYSPRMRLDLVVNTMFKTAMVDGKIIVNNPSIWRPILSLQDAVSAYVRSVESSLDISGVFNIASDNFTVGEIADIISKELKNISGENIKLIINNNKDYRNYKVSTLKAKDVLGFHSNKGITDIVNDLYHNMKNFKDYDNDNYYNINVFKKMKLK